MTNNLTVTEKALLVLVLTETTAHFLLATDPKALLQALDALEHVRELDPDNPVAERLFALRYLANRQLHVGYRQ